MFLRSILFMPGNREKILSKIGTVNSDGVILDLEDSVPFNEKDVARRLILRTLDSLEQHKTKLYVRVNALLTGLIEEDIKCVIHKNLHGLIIPKVQTQQEVKDIEEIVHRIAADKGIDSDNLKFHIIFETALGVINAYEITTSSKMIEAVAFGAEDFTLDIGATRTTEGWELFYSRSRILLAAKAARVMAIDTVFSDLSDKEGLFEDSKTSKMLGFDGKYVIHPKQIEIVNKVFTPSDKEIDFAKKVIAAFEQAQRENKGVVTVEGKMIDAPIFEKAERIIHNMEALSKQLYDK